MRPPGQHHGGYAHEDADCAGHADNIKKIEEIVATLDRRTPQVMIEAKIVTLSTFYAEELGIQWLGNFNVDAQHGNALDYRFPYSVNQQDSGGNASLFGVNLPRVIGSYAQG